MVEHYRAPTCLKNWVLYCSTVQHLHPFHQHPQFSWDGGCMHVIIASPKNRISLWHSEEFFSRVEISLTCQEVSKAVLHLP